MAKSLRTLKNARGRPPTYGEPVTVRLSPEVLSALDAARAAMEIEPSRPDVLRAALLEWLRARGRIK